jgi:hypothetical protein
VSNRHKSRHHLLLVDIAFETMNKKRATDWSLLKSFQLPHETHADRGAVRGAPTRISSKN